MRKDNDSLWEKYLELINSIATKEYVYSIYGPLKCGLTGNVKCRMIMQVIKGLDNPKTEEWARGEYQWLLEGHTHNKDFYEQLKIYRKQYLEVEKSRLVERAMAL